MYETWGYVIVFGAERNLVEIESMGAMEAMVTVFLFFLSFFFKNCFVLFAVFGSRCGVLDRWGACYWCAACILEYEFSMNLVWRRAPETRIMGDHSCPSTGWQVPAKCEQASGHIFPVSRPPTNQPISVNSSCRRHTPKRRARRNPRVDVLYLMETPSMQRLMYVEFPLPGL